MMALLHEASTGLNGVNVFASVSYVEGVTVYNVCEQAVVGSESFTLNFYTGESEEQVTTPALIVSSENATEDQDAVGNALVDVQIDLMFPADSATNENVIAKLEAASVWVHQMIRRPDFASMVNNQHCDVSICGIDPSGYSGQRMAEGRQRVHRYSVRMYAAGRGFVE
jgi:hypothetical protein